MSRLPHGWTLARVGDIATEISYGFTAKATNTGAGLRYLRITDIQNETVHWDSVPSCRIPSGKVDNYRLRSGDIVFARTGATTGKSFLIHTCPDAIFASYLIRVRTASTVLPEFLHSFFKSHSYWSQITESTSGSAQPNCNASKLARLSVPIPPLAEQRRIVAELDAVLARVRASQQRLEKVPAILRRFRQAVLGAACSGKLTADWRIQHGKLTPESSSEVAALLSVPPTWRCERLGSRLAGIDAGRSFTCEERPPKSGEAGVLKISALTWDTYNEQESKTCKDKSRWEPTFEVKEGDFLLSRANTIELVGAPVIVNKVTMRLMLSDKTLRLRFSNLNPRWALLWLKSQYGRQEIENLATGNQQSMRNISQESIRAIRIAVPPAPEQDEIVRRVEALFVFADRLESRLKKATEQVEQLTQSILAKAFRGELVPTEAELAEAEGRDFESAEELLERIRAEQSEARNGTGRGTRARTAKPVFRKAAASGR